MYGPVDKDEHNFGAHAIGVSKADAKTTAPSEIPTST
jgi:hypothetical protein